MAHTYTHTHTPGIAHIHTYIHTFIHTYIQARSLYLHSHTLYTHTFPLRYIVLGIFAIFFQTRESGAAHFTCVCAYLGWPGEGTGIAAFFRRAPPLAACSCRSLGYAGGICSAVAGGLLCAGVGAGDGVLEDMEGEV
ncbi:hypothetical protein DFJ77DRAFT_473248 [Powellomyces hirtus]|nr:hypothetical protein DFJ77DRAFT_473248 [Powellomyces hirtus]